MASRSYFTPQGGRQGKSGVKKEDEWGTTSSQAEFRAYEPAEMRNARDAPRHLKTCVEIKGGNHLKTQKAPQLNVWKRLEEQYPDHSKVSAYTASEQSGPISRPSKPAKTQGTQKPAWATVHENPIPEKQFLATTSYADHQKAAQQARHGHFPYRDEYAPRSKRLLYELALAKCSRDSVASGSTASASAYTMTSRASDAPKSIARSTSEPSVASSHHTADTNRVIGGVAKRRKELTFRSPNLSRHDQEWFREKWEKEGPNGLAFTNYKPSYYAQSFQQDCEKTLAMRRLLPYHLESEMLSK